jgi:hypothetical protein
MKRREERKMSLPSYFSSDRNSILFLEMSKKIIIYSLGRA